MRDAKKRLKMKASGARLRRLGKGCKPWKGTSLIEDLVEANIVVFQSSVKKFPLVLCATIKPEDSNF